MLRYKYETKYRTATVMEEDALNQPTAAGELSALQMQMFFFSVRPRVLVYLCLSSSSSSSLEADLSLHTLSESPCGSLVVYVIPESSSLLPQVKTFNFFYM